MAQIKKNWKANLGNWTFIQSLLDTGTLLCLTEQERSTLQTFLRPAYWRTRWIDAPDKDVLEAFCAEIERKLMEDCTLSLVQIGCTINLVLNGVIISTMPFDGEACSMLGGADGEGSGDYELEAQSEDIEDKKTELFSGAMALVKFCSEAVIDFFAAIDAEIELGLAATVWMEAVPGLDLSPAYEVLQAADSLNDMLRSAFLSSDTPIWREQESCRIMCWCVNNNFTFDVSVIDKWRDWLGDFPLEFPEQGYSTIVQVMTNRALLNRFALGMNDDDEDWLILCDECDDIFGSLTFDDEENDLEYTIEYGEVGDIGNPDDGLMGAEWHEAPWHYGRQATVLVDLGEDVHVKVVRFDWQYDNFPNGECSRRIYLLDEEEEVLDSWVETSNEVKNEWHTENEQFDEEGVRFVRVKCLFNSDYSGAQHVYIDNIEVYKQAE